MLEKLVAVLIVGPPLAGKTTQGDFLDLLPEYVLIPFGRIIRTGKSESVQKAKQFMKDREPVPASLVKTILCETIFDYIEIFYNRQRSHSKLGYITPCQYEEYRMAA